MLYNQIQKHIGNDFKIKKEIKLDRIIYTKTFIGFDVVILEESFIVLEVKNIDYKISSIIKMANKIGIELNQNTIISFKNLNSYEKKVCFKSKTNFITDSEFYISNLLKVNTKNILEVKEEKFDPLTQLIFLKLIYSEEKYSYDDFVTLLGISKMSVSRAIQKLNMLDLINIEKTGVYVNIKVVQYSIKSQSNSGPLLS